MNTDFRIMPEQASTIAGDVDLLYLTLIGVSVAISTIIACLLVFFAIKYRRGSKAVRRPAGHSNMLLVELSWVIAPFILSMFLFVWGAKLYFVQSFAPAGAIEINCVGRQWMWKFQHPEGTSEINDLHVPLGQNVKLNMISEDVIHSMYVPAFRIKHDVLPGRYTSVWFNAVQVGQYHLFCAEYCGAKHSTMIGTVHVMEPRDYQKWLSEPSGKSSPSSSGRHVPLLEQLKCTGCHLGGGEASRGPSLQNIVGKTVRLKGGQSIVADDNYIRESILNPKAKIVVGYEPIMPSYAGQIDEASILQLISEIKSLGQKPLRDEEKGPEKGTPKAESPDAPKATPKKSDPNSSSK
jgi:cytochrome c oxidase subunit 2